MIKKTGTVSGYGKYKVDVDGCVWSRARGRWKKLKGSSDKTGYIGFALINNKGESVRWKAHRFVATAMIPNPDNKPEINHKNGKKGDNRPDNLEWVTRSENIKHRYEELGQHGSFYSKLGKDHKDSTPVIQFNIDGGFKGIHWGMAEAKRKTGANNVHQCCNGVQRSSGGYMWAYADHNNLQRVINGMSNKQVGRVHALLFEITGQLAFAQLLATPRQKCEAILKAYGKWEEE